MKTPTETIAQLHYALSRLVLEAKHYAETGSGRTFLNAAVQEAEEALDSVPRRNPNEGCLMTPETGNHYSPPGGAQ